MDGRVPRQVREVCEDGEIDMILSTKGLRASRKRSRCPKEWVSRRTSVRHEDMGGLTTGEVTCWLHVVEGVSVSDDLATMKKVPRDGMTVISSVERCQRRINVEKWPVPITPLRVVRVGPGGLAFHGGGLFPVDLGTESLVAAPCCFFGGSWGLRKFTMRELLAIRGVSGGQMAAILDWEMKGEDSVLPGMVPVDALAEAGNRLLTAGGRPVLKWERALGQRQGGSLGAPPPTAWG